NQREYAMKPRRSAKPYTPPEHGHAILTEAEQAKFLGRGNEVVSNLGHRSRKGDLTRHPLKTVPTCDTASQAERQIKEGKRLTQGVYRRHVPINDGRSTAENLRVWSKYSQSNSYHGGHGEGVSPTMADPRGTHTDRSDGYLLSTRGWANLPDAGAESGEGRLQKIRKQQLRAGDMPSPKPRPLTLGLLNVRHRASRQQHRHQRQHRVKPKPSPNLQASHNRSPPCATRRSPTS